jgi:adenylate cyclase
VTSLHAIRECLEGAVPATVATCAADGTPNISYVSEVHYVDREHVALSFQFFNKTHQNILAHPYARVTVIHPATGEQYQLVLRYLRTETQGALFERMRAKLAGIASHTGMSGVFRLQGSDVYRVQSIERLPGPALPRPASGPNVLSALRGCAEAVSACGELGALFDESLAALERFFEVRHSMLLLLDEAGNRLYTVASRGYAASGVGSEVAVGCGVIGVAAAHRTPIRITHMSAEYSYGKAIRESAEQGGLGSLLETAIPFPGLPEPGSQLAAPILHGKRLLGVLYVESPEDMRFGYDEEDALVSFAAQLGGAIVCLQQSAEAPDEAPAAGRRAAPSAEAPVLVRHFAADHSVFVGDDYLIKGVAGSIFAKLLRECAESGRTEFSNRELRLDPSIRLPDVGDNLEARLVLLQRRLAERCSFLRLEKTGRGRFRLVAERAFRLSEA